MVTYGAPIKNYAEISLSRLRTRPKLKVRYRTWNIFELNGYFLFTTTTWGSVKVKISEN
jgi:hypothetical protein